VKAIVFVVVIMIGLGLGCTRFSKPISQLEPYSFTFDFTSAPDPINSGGEGDDWLYEWFDGTGYYVPAASQVSYNQTIGGKSGVAKWSKIDDANWSYGSWTAYSPHRELGATFDNKFGRINSYPSNVLEYSTFRLKADVYYTGVVISGNWPILRFGLGGGLGLDGSAEGYSVPLAIQEDQWITYDTGEQSVSGQSFDGLSNIVIRFSNGDNSSTFENGGFVALHNVTLSFTP